MSSKYQKPKMRNMGDSVLSAQGICMNGSVATDPLRPNCVAGANASGGTCIVGNEVKGCRTGFIADVDTCITGSGVGLPD
jgi:hypothetical protein